MAIYHLEAKVISRGAGRSAVAAAAYMSCSQILNDYDGVQHDYTRKRGLVWQQVFLPQYAPAEWQDRNALWNAVEKNEKTKDSRLAREFVVALPIELTSAQWQELLSNFIQNSFVADGMCADVAIHDTDGHNPHAHIMLIVRPLDEQGNWQYKTEKEYLCIRNGEEQGFTAVEFKKAQADGWEKQYQYKVGKKKVYMPPSEAEKHGYERANKHPKSTKYGRQNPIAERWNSEDQLVLTRRITELTEELEELKSEKQVLLNMLNCASDADISAVKKEICTLDSLLRKLSEQETKHSAELDDALKQYAELQKQAADFDATELMNARLAIRADRELDADNRIKAVYKEKYNSRLQVESRRTVDKLLGDNAATQSIWERLYHAHSPIQQKRNPQYRERER